MAGTLYIVATPIGNLEDITYRAVNVLREVSLIACEDTRHSRKLIDHFGIQTPLISYYEQNEAARAIELVERLLSGESLALISDAGTPLISDPGYRVVAQAVASGIGVVSVPGASAILTALAASGLPTDSFYFGGFLPAKSVARQATLRTSVALDCTLIFYEAPHRIVDTLEDIAGLMPLRPVVVARELTKLHEEFLRGSAAEVKKSLAERPAIKGEMTVLIGKAEGKIVDDRPIDVVFTEHLAAGMSRMDAIKAIARERDLPKRAVYALIEKAEL